MVKPNLVMQPWEPPLSLDRYKRREDTLSKFKERGGIVTMLEGEARAAFDNMMSTKVAPAMADMIDSGVLEAAHAFAAD